MLKSTAQSFRPEDIGALITLALREDIGTGDVTSGVLIPDALKAHAVLLAKAEGVLAGINVARLVYAKLNPEIKFKILLKDGEALHPGGKIAEINGNARAILAGERTALNFLQRLSGIATMTHRFVTAVGDLPVWIVDTRKTTPGYRLLEKYAVRMGGGRNHRINLADGILIKDNHLAILRARGLTLKDAVVQARDKAPRGMLVEVETTTLAEVKEAVAAGADIVMFDNMSPAMMKKAVRLLPDGVWSEASGGVTLETVREIAETGVKMISIGALTHSSKALDISLEILG